MQAIYPITGENCKAHYGKPVLIYLHDGSEIQGIMSRVEKGNLILNDVPPSQIEPTARENKMKSKVKRRKKNAAKASIKAIDSPFDYPNSFGAQAIDLTSIAALYLLI
jgi:small nuclear ribonucleoprotein (snRNP)-like protein